VTCDVNLEGAGDEAVTSMKPRSKTGMKNFRVFDGTTQYIAADTCEVTPQNILFFEAGRIIKRYEIAAVRSVEELDDGLRAQNVIYKKGPLDRIEH